MPSKLKEFLQRWVINTLAVLVAAHIIRGIHYDSVVGLLVATLLLGLLNAFIRPVLMMLSLPLLIVTLGLFTIVINALLLSLVSALVKDFKVDSFGAALLGALVISIISTVLHLLTGTGHARVEVRRGRPPPKRDDGGDGPVIDV